jgi:hypothetical protein
MLIGGNRHSAFWTIEAGRSRRKNDRMDAEKLAKLLFLGMVPLVHVPSPDVRSERWMIRHRQSLIRERPGWPLERGSQRDISIRVENGERPFEPETRSDALTPAGAVPE